MSEETTIPTVPPRQLLLRLYRERAAPTADTVQAICTTMRAGGAEARTYRYVVHYRGTEMGTRRSYLLTINVPTATVVLGRLDGELNVPTEGTAL